MASNNSGTSKTNKYSCTYSDEWPNIFPVSKVNDNKYAFSAFRAKELFHVSTKEIKMQTDISCEHQRKKDADRHFV